MRTTVTIDDALYQEALEFINPNIDKSELFPSVIRSGTFPAKSFSIGPARDKRYYLECRKIK